MRTVTMLMTTVLLGFASTAFAGPKCSAPKDQWMKESDFRAMVEKRAIRSISSKSVLASVMKSMAGMPTAKRSKSISTRPPAMK